MCFHSFALNRIEKLHFNRLNAIFNIFKKKISSGVSKAYWQYAYQQDSSDWKFSFSFFLILISLDERQQILKCFHLITIFFRFFWKKKRTAHTWTAKRDHSPFGWSSPKFSFFFLCHCSFSIWKRNLMNGTEKDKQGKSVQTERICFLLFSSSFFFCCMITKSMGNEKMEEKVICITISFSPYFFFFSFSISCCFFMLALGSRLGCSWSFDNS